MSEFVQWVGDGEDEVPVTGNSSEEPVTGPTKSDPSTATSSHVVTGCGCDLERRVRVRMAEAQDAASDARERTVDLVKRGTDSPAELTRLWALVRTHEQLAEALNAVLE